MTQTATKNCPACKSTDTESYFHSSPARNEGNSGYEESGTVCNDCGEQFDTDGGKTY